MPDEPQQSTGDEPGSSLPVGLVGDEIVVPCVDGCERAYLSFDAAASTSALAAVALQVQDFMPWYSSVHRGAGLKSREATARYEQARMAALRFAGRPPDGGDVAIICRNTTEAINHLAFRLQLDRADVVVTTVVEHHANLLPWARMCQRRFVECGPDGIFSVDAVVGALDGSPAPRLLAITGASNVTGWLPPVEEIIVAAHDRGVPVLVDAAQLAPHRPLPAAADYVAWSGHKMYAPFGAGVLIGPRTTFAEGDPFLAGGGAVDLVDLDEVVWTDPPEREEAGSPNVVGAVALGAAIGELGRIGWGAIATHDDVIGARLRTGLDAIDTVSLLGPDRSTPTLPLATFTIAGVHHALGGGAPERGVRDRCPSRLLLRSPLSAPPAGPKSAAGGPIPRGGVARRSSRCARRGASQCRAVHLGGGRRPPRGRGDRDRIGPPGSGGVRAGPDHGGLLARR